MTLPSDGFEWRVETTLSIRDQAKSRAPPTLRDSARKKPPAQAPEVPNSTAKGLEVAQFLPALVPVLVIRALTRTAGLMLRMLVLVLALGITLMLLLLAVAIGLTIAVLSAAALLLVSLARPVVHLVRHGVTLLFPSPKEQRRPGGAVPRNRIEIFSRAHGTFPTPQH
jgi:hypothetical protein